MREEQAIVEVIRISTQGELRHFEIKVPLNAIAVIGVQTGVMLKGKAAETPRAIPALPVEIKETKSQPFVIGELKLQSLTKPNLFYGTLIREPFAGEDFANPLAPLGYREKDWIYGYKKEWEKIQVSASPVIVKGLFKDFLGESAKRDLTYDVFLALWFRIEQPKKMNLCKTA